MTLLLPLNSIFLGYNFIYRYYITSTIEDSYSFIVQQYQQKNTPLHLFVTGSLYLCGDLLNTIHYSS